VSFHIGQQAGRSSGGVDAQQDAASHHVVGGNLYNLWPSFKQQQGLLGNLKSVFGFFWE
jgi:hypothetical protein